MLAADAVEATCVDVLRAELPQLMAVYAFGSRVTGGARADSDRDIAMLVPRALTAELLWSLRERLADVCGHSVDLVDLRAASTVMQHQVISRGRRAWHAGSDADLFEAFVMGQKLELDAARAPLIRDIEARGRIHGR